ncbi:MAG: lipoprotein [Gallionellaceae bacterium]|nr:MAG: lipoprotein [Gallionellaceae bacterium]
MKKLLVILLLCMSTQALAVELEGIKVEDKVQVNNAALTLNGAGVRNIVFFKMYVIGLYLAEKQQSADAILADAKPKRIALHVLVGEAGAERFLSGFRKGIEKNHSEAQLAALRERMTAFEQMFGAIKTVKRNDVIAFDWLPAEGSRISLNGTELGRIAGDDFYRALLSIWIGGKPVTNDLKKALSDS